MSRPLVSIVTPSLNMAAWIGRTIESVLAQDYPYVEYIVVDGGSTDATPQIVASYAGRLQALCAPDSGPAEAINRGFALARGEIFAWLAADDYYLPGAVSAAVAALEADPELGAVYGDADWVDAAGRLLGRYPARAFDARRLAEECFIPQPAAFFRREAFLEAGGLDPRWRYTFDYDLWIRLSRRRPVRHLPVRLAAGRMHPDTITLGARRRVLEENIRLLVHHYGYAPFSRVFAYAAHRVDGRDQFFEPLRPSFVKYALSLPLGLYFNRRRPGRYLADWLAAGLRGLRCRSRAAPDSARSGRAEIL